MRLSLIFIFFLLTNSLFGQDEDFELRSGLSIEREITKRVEAEIQFQYRREENVQQFKLFFTELTGQYKFSKNIKAAVNYRYVWNNEVNQQRISTDVSWKEKFKRLTISNRVRFQKDFQINELTENILRNKLDISYNLRKSKVSPFISGEIFYELHYKDDLFNKFRLTCGMEYKLNKRWDTEMYLMRQWEANVYAPKSATIMGINLSYTWKKKKKKVKR